MDIEEVRDAVQHMTDAGESGALATADLADAIRRLRDHFNERDEQ